MSSIVTNYQKSFEAINASANLAVATPITAIFNQQTPQIDFGVDQLTIELYKGNRKSAPLVSRRSAGSDIENSIIRPGSSGANDYLYSLIMQELEIPAGTLNKRTPEESPYVTGNPDDIKMMRQRYWLTKLGIDAVRRILIKDEILAKQSFFDSEMAIGDTWQSATKLVFPRNAALKARTVSVSWATAASAVPWTDIGNAQRAIKEHSQVDGANMWIMFLSSATMEYLKAIYRSQRSAKDTGPNLEYNEFKFNPEQEVDPSLRFLIENGMEYNGWIRTAYSNSRVQLFTLPQGYDLDGTYTDFISGNTAALCLYNPAYFKAYYGPGKKSPPDLNIYQRVLPVLNQTPNVSSGLTLGMSRVPARTMLFNLYELGKNDGFGACYEHAPVFAPIRPDVVATIATTTTG